MFGKKKASRRVQVISAYGQTWRDDEYDDDEYEDDTPFPTMEKKSTQSGQCMICSAVYENDYGIKKHRCIMCRKQVCSRCCTGVDPVCTECMPAMGGGRGVANFVAPPARRSPPLKSPGRQMKAPPAPPPSVSKKSQVKKQGWFGRKSPGPSPPKAMSPPKKQSSYFGFGRKSPGPSPPKEAPKKRIAPPKKKSPPPSPLPPKKAPPMKTNGKVNSLESELQKLMADTAGRNPTIGERDRIKELMLHLKDDESTDTKSSAKIPPRPPAAAFKKPAPFKKAAPAKQKSPPAFLNKKKPAPRLPAAKPASKPWSKKALPPKKPASKPWSKKAAPTLPPKKPASKPWNKKPAPKKPASKPWNKKPAPKKPPSRPMHKFNSGPPTPPKFSKPSVPKSKRTSKTFKLGSRGFRSPFSKKPPPKPAGKSKPGVKTGSVKDAIARRNKLDQGPPSAPKTSASRWK